MMLLRCGLKKIANVISIFIVFPLFFLYRVFSGLGRGAFLFQAITQALSLIPGKTGSYLRKSFLYLALPSVSMNCVISFGTIFSHPDVEIGDGAYIGPYCSIGRASIGRDVLISDHVSIISGKNQHRFEDLNTPIREQGGIFEKVTIGDDTWIGTGAIVASNIGSQSVIGAGSVVLKEIPERSIVLGNPARIVGKRE